MPLLLLWHPAAQSGPGPQPEPSPELPAQMSVGSSWGSAAYRRRREQLEHDDEDLLQIMGFALTLKAH